MQSENSFHLILFENTGLADILGAAGGFLRRLEDQQNIVAQLFLFAQPAGQLQQNGHMAVMTAGVHPAGMAGRKVQPGIFRNGQGIRIGAKSDGFLCPEVKPGTKCGLHGRKHFARQVFQCRTQIGHSLGQIPIQFRNPVQGPPICYDIHKSLLQAILDLLYNICIANAIRRPHLQQVYS